MTILGITAPLQEALDYHLSRHNLLTANLAHVDTPNFKAQDLYRSESFRSVLDVQMQVTDAGHLGGSTRAANWSVKVDPNSPISPDGNSVSLDREAVKIASNNLRYDAITSMIRKRFEGLTWAARDGRG